MHTIAVDIDDVLAANAAGFLAYSNEQWGTNLSVDDYDERWSVMWGVTNEETERRAEQFHASGAIAQYAHFEAAIPVLADLSKDHKLIVVTSRRQSVIDETRAWLGEYFGGMFHDIHFAGIWDRGSADAHKHTKAELCKSLGVTVLIDDQLKHCLAVANLGMKSILFGDYAWNRSSELPEGVTRCHDWLAVKEYLYGNIG